MAEKLSQGANLGFPSKQIWVSTSHSKTNFLVWVLALDKYLSRSNLCKLGVHIPNQSRGICGLVPESCDHLCIHCPLAARLWEHFINSAGLSWVMSRSVKALLCSWKLFGLSKKGKLVWKTIPAAVLVIVWSESNSRFP
ncbi:PREDICTED: uncharacterized protein LOC104588737 [Nelumbo nucifera]|uniref:Uncharacterized protein LOC104588737 n=1 Tax=Nelumbo nucifera TaxID=4432 RepID=A0A1U7ZCQ2_NELNU|nr:PREDICTED: uncharacterized protein LOC104588737 [Nelumbo nucifera]